MAIFLQTEREITRLEMIATVHQALTEVARENPQLSLRSNPADAHFQEEQPHKAYPTVAYFGWRRHVNPVLYNRSVRRTWDKAEKEGLDAFEQTIVNAVRAQALQHHLHLDSMLLFPTGGFMADELGDGRKSSTAGRLSYQIAAHLLEVSPVIVSVAFTTLYRNRIELCPVLPAHNPA